MEDTASTVAGEKRQAEEALSEVRLPQVEHAMEETKSAARVSCSPDKDSTPTPMLLEKVFSPASPRQCVLGSPPRLVSEHCTSTVTLFLWMLMEWRRLGRFTDIRLS
jgi:hypothetical protein